MPTKTRHFGNCEPLATNVDGVAEYPADGRVDFFGFSFL